MGSGLLSPTHLAVVLAIALIVFGPKRLPELGRALGQGMRGFKEALGGGDDDESPTGAVSPVSSGQVGDDVAARAVATEPAAANSPGSHPPVTESAGVEPVVAPELAAERAAVIPPEPPLADAAGVEPVAPREPAPGPVVVKPAEAHDDPSGG